MFVTGGQLDVSGLGHQRSDELPPDAGVRHLMRVKLRQQPAGKRLLASPAVA